MKIKEIASIISESVPNPAESGFEKFVGLEHYDAGEPKITRYGSTDMLKTAMKHFLPSDVLVARRNVYLRRAGIVDFEGLTSGDSIVLRPKNDDIARYLPFILNSNAFWDFADANSDGTMSKRLSPKILLDYEFDLPPIEEQRVLADKLWAAYRLKESYRRLLAATQEMVKSQFIEMFGDLEPQRLIDIVERSGEYGSNTPADVYDGSIRYVRITDIDDEGRLNNDVVSPKKIEERYLLKDNDIIFARTGNTVGKTYLHEGGKMIFAGYLIRYRCKKDVMLPKFLFSFTHTSSYFDWVSNTKKVGAQPNISAKQYDNMPVPVPPMELQEQFVAIAEQADKSGFELRKSIDAIDNVIKSLINNQS